MKERFGQWEFYLHCFSFIEEKEDKQKKHDCTQKSHASQMVENLFLKNLYV